MATLFLDFENGQDFYSGTSFTDLASGVNGRITGTTFSAATANFPNDGSLIGHYLSINNGSGLYLIYNITAWVSATSLTIAALSNGTALANQAVDRLYFIGGRWKTLTTGATAVRTNPGDTIRIMGSPAPTSLGQNGVWTSQALQATKNLVSSTNATPIAITCTAHGYSTGDTVVITGHTTNTAANGTWEITNTGANTFTLAGSVGNGVGGASGTVRLRNNSRVKLTTAVTRNIASTGPGRTAWTASASVTTTINTTAFKEHDEADSIAIATGFTTGKAAYWATGTVDLSGYQQVSFWIQQTTGTIGAAGAVNLRLCSDAAGVTAVNTINIPALGATGRWMPVTVDLGTNLGSSIQSIALYVNTDNGAQTFLLNNIIACKASSSADSLTLTSLIGKNTTGETFWGIQSINGTRVMLDADTNARPIDAAVRGYYGTSETVTTWKRETIKLGPAAAATTVLQTFQESGTGVSPITYSGGWDRTAMSTQTLETWLDGVNGNGYLLSTNNLSFLTLSKVAFVRAARAIDNGGGTANDWQIVTVASMTGSNFSFPLNLTGPGGRLTLGHGVACLGPALRTASFDGIVILEHGIFSCATEGFYNSTTPPGILYGGTASTLIANNNGYGVYIVSAGSCIINNITTADNVSGGFTASNGGIFYCNNCLISDSTEVGVNSGAIYSQNHDKTTGNHKIFLTTALISSAIDQRHTASGISWKMQPTSTNRSSTWPVTLSLAKVACSANNLVTIKAWMRRDNAGLTMRLVCKGGQLAGVASDVVSALTTTNAWEEETITFTPTETGVVEITAEAWGGTTFSGWVDDMTITQA